LRRSIPGEARGVELHSADCEAAISGLARWWSMKTIRLIVLIALPLAGCGKSDSIAPRNTVMPAPDMMSESPGDWTRLSGAVGRTPSESSLFVRSAMSTDLNAMLGADAEDFRRAMADAGPLRPGAEGTLVTRSESGQGWLVLQPGDHAIAARFRSGKGWRRVRTPGSDVPLPEDLRTEDQSSPAASSANSSAR
jgi:hypothetical protein